MSDLIIYTRKCRICRLAEHAPDVRRVVDAWLLGTAPTQEDPPIVEGEQARGAAVADYLTRVIGKTFHRQEGPSHRRMCLTPHVDEAGQGEGEGQEQGGAEGGEGDGREGVEEHPPPPPPSPPPAKVSKRKAGYQPPTLKEAIKTGRVIQANYARLADERLVDEYLVEGLRLMRTIRRKAEGRAEAPPSMTDSLITASEAHFVLGLGLNIDKLMTLRPFVRATTLNDGLPVAPAGAGPTGALGGKGEQGAAGVQGLLARVRKEQADPPPIPGDGDDDPIENGRGSQILDEEARREAEEAAREAEGEDDGAHEGETKAEVTPPSSPVVGNKSGSTPPPAPSPLPPDTSPPASAPQLRVVAGGGAQKPANHGETAWAWKPGARDGG